MVKARVLDALRVAMRGVLVFLMLLVALGDYLVLRLRARAAFTEHDRAVWARHWATEVLRLFGVECAIFGPVPQDGLVISNHLGYLDVLVLMAAHPSVFVSKKEIKSWPVFGWLAQCVGTIFVERRTRDDLPAVTKAMAEVLRRGQSIVLFPEGTSTNGQEGVLPFHAALFEAAVQAQVPVRPVCLRYTTPAGKPEPRAYYWGDDTLVLNIARLVGARRLCAEVRFSTESKIFDGRHPAAMWSRAVIQEMLAGKEKTVEPQVSEATQR